jgi:hypothetical protein
MTANGIGIWKDAVVTNFKILYQQLSEWTRETHKKPQSHSRPTDEESNTGPPTMKQDN